MHPKYLTYPPRTRRKTFEHELSTSLTPSNYLHNPRMSVLKTRHVPRHATPAPQVKADEHTVQEALPVLEALAIPPAAPEISESIEAMKARVPQRGPAARDVGWRRHEATKSLNTGFVTIKCFVRPACLRVSVAGDLKMR